MSNRLNGLTIAVSENKYLAQIAKRTVLSDDALSVLVPILEDIVGMDAGGIHALFESRGLVLQEWDKVQTDLLRSRDGRGAADGCVTPEGTRDLVGWLATAIFAISYFCKRTTTLAPGSGIRRPGMGDLRRADPLPPDHCGQRHRGQPGLRVVAVATAGPIRGDASGRPHRLSSRRA